MSKAITTRRQFLGATVTGLAGAALTAPVLGAAPDDVEPLSFLFLGDTHYQANRAQPKELTGPSRLLTNRLIDWLNRLPGSAIPENAGGGKVGTPRGLIHAGDLIDSGDRTAPNDRLMQETELATYNADFGQAAGRIEPNGSAQAAAR